MLRAIVDDSDPSAHWGYFCTEEAFPRLEEIPTHAGHAGVCFLSPTLLAITFADNVWSAINVACAVCLDHFEESELEPTQAALVADLLEAQSQRYTDGEIRRAAQRQIEPTEVHYDAVMAAVEVRRRLQELAGFLRRCAGQELRVIASL